MKTNRNKVYLFNFIFLAMLVACSENPVQNLESEALNEIITAEHNPASSIAAANSPVIITFDKKSDGVGVWVGTVSGDVEGGLETIMLGHRETGKIWHVEFKWIITAGEQSFTAHLNGILNFNTGKVVMNGTVIEGWLKGARVHEEGQLIDSDKLQFEGTIQINPATGNRPRNR